MIDGVRLSEAIARHKEPFDALPTITRCGQRSPQEFWVSVSDNNHETAWLEWYPRDVTDPEISMRLLKELLAMGWELHPVIRNGVMLNLFQFYRFNRQQHGMETLRETEFEGPLENAIGPAYAKAVGLDVEG